MHLACQKWSKSIKNAKRLSMACFYQFSVPNVAVCSAEIHWLAAQAGWVCEWRTETTLSIFRELEKNTSSVPLWKIKIRYWYQDSFCGIYPEGMTIQNLWIFGKVSNGPWPPGWHKLGDRGTTGQGLLRHEGPPTYAILSRNSVLSRFMRFLKGFRRALNESHPAFVEHSTKAILLS